MNLNKFGRWSGIVVAVAMLAMVLQGCGGDDNGADQDMRDQLAMLQGDLDAANAAKMEAETAKTMADQAATDAMAAKMTAEMERDEANVARGAAETAKVVADQAATDAMAAQEAAEAAQATAEMAQEAAEMAKTTAETDRDSYKMMAEEANTAKMAADQAKMVAETAKMVADQAATDAMAAQATAEMERDEANTAKMAADQAAADAMTAKMEAEAERDKYKMMLADLQGEIDTGEMTMASAAAKELLRVLSDNTANVPPTGVQGVTLDAPPTADEISVSVSSEGMLMAEVTGYTVADMPTDMIEGWRGATLTNKEGDTVVLYSDIGNDGTQSLLDRYASSLPMPNSSRSWAIDNDDTNDVDNMDMDISWTVVTRPDDMSMVGGTIAMPMVTFMGSVHNISGTFSCIGSPTACVAPVRFSDDAVADATATTGSATGDWMFAPDEGVDTYTDDTDYLLFGWWLSKGSDGNPDDYTPITMAMGLGAGAMDDARTGANTSGTGADGLRGSATYKGAAAGKYAIASTSADAHEGGHFTAMATLMMDFDADLTPVAGDPNDRAGVAISGMIDNFMTGDTSRPDWMLKLMVDDDLDDTNTVLPVASLVDATDARMLTEWSTGGAAKGTGTWTASYYGGATPDGDTGIPNAAIGTFGASMGSIGRLQGAFGVMKE